MTHAPDRIARIGSMVLDLLIPALIVGAIVCGAMWLVDRYKPERIVVPDYHPRLAK